MIIFEDVHKRYVTDDGNKKWILQGASFRIPAKMKVGLVGLDAASNAALLRLIGGIDAVVTRGKIERCGRFSWPMGFGGALQNTLTGRQNARFICRIHGHTKDIEDRLAYIQDFSELGASFDKPIKSYSGNMRNQLLFSLFIASDFDVYISDVGVAAGGDKAFRDKAIEALKKLTDDAGLLMVGNDHTLKQFCNAGIWLHEGQVRWFDDINEALTHHKEGSAV
jgi:capsular polysaccharide transport system ATP-binding protein